MKLLAIALVAVLLAGCNRDVDDKRLYNPEPINERYVERGRPVMIYSSGAGGDVTYRCQWHRYGASNAEMNVYLDGEVEPLNTEGFSYKPILTVRRMGPRELWAWCSDMKFQVEQLAKQWAEWPQPPN